MKRNIIFSLLLVTGLTAIKAQDTLSSQLKRSIVKRYSSILPLLSAAGEFGSGSSSFIDGTLGLRIGQGINIKKIKVTIYNFTQNKFVYM
ncbi:MAG: hypothetical protein KF900_05805 [Bacteroidetes bacterium]|nr:hypothetical protein [Bacteroidota bacterium]